MIVAEQTRDLEQSGMGRTVQAKIKASRKLFSFFSDGVYSNKPVAIARELVANAVDSHVMAGKPDLPVDVVLPTALDPVFIVRDHGIGMSEDFLFNNYLVYAEGSTKDGSNEAIGGFGIGKAAVFSYTDQFSLVSIQDGVRGVYSVFVGDDGIPAISQISVSTTDETNGVEISFPVEDKDVQLFHDAAQTALMYFNPLPNVENGTVHGPDYTFVGKDWALRPDAGELGVILGGVRYPVQAASLSRVIQNDPKISPLLQYGIDLTMPIGSVSIALSREALSYNDQTNNSIKKALFAIFDDVKATFGTMFDNQPTLWAAAAMLYKEAGIVSNGWRQSQTARQQLLAANAVYKGKKLETGIKLRGHQGVGKIWSVPAKTAWGRKRSLSKPVWVSFDETGFVTPGVVESVLLDDTAATPKSKAGLRIKEYLEAQSRSKEILVLRPPQPTDIQQAPDQASIDKMLDILGNPDVVLVSSLPMPVKAARTSTAMLVRPRVRMFTWDGSPAKNHWGSTEDFDNLTPARNKPVVEIKYADQPATGIMVVMENFDLPKDFKTKMATGLIKYNELHFVNKTDEPKLTAFKKFDDVFADRLVPALAKLPADVNARIALAQDPTFEQTFSLINRIQDQQNIWMKMSRSQTETPFGKIVKLWVDYVKGTGNDLTKFKPFLAPALPIDVNPDAMIKALKTEQPQVSTMLGLMFPQYGAPNLKREHIALLLRVI